MRPFSGTLSAAAGPRLQDLLGDTSDGSLSVLHTGPRAVNLAVDRPGPQPWCLGVVGSRAAALPNALRLALPDLRSLDLVEPALEDGAVRLGSITLRVSRLVDVRVPPLRVAVEGDLGDVDSLVARVGLGDGLTPYADDVLCGWLAVQVGADRLTAEVAEAVRASFGRTTLLSATLLDCALRGEVLPEFAAYVRALGTDDQVRREEALAAIGESSGRGLLTGARLALGAHAVLA